MCTLVCSCAVCQVGNTPVLIYLFSGSFKFPLRITVPQETFTFNLLYLYYKEAPQKILKFIVYVCFNSKGGIKALRQSDPSYKSSIPHIFEIADISSTGYKTSAPHHPAAASCGRTRDLCGTQGIQRWVQMQEWAIKIFRKGQKYPVGLSINRRVEGLNHAPLRNV